MLGLERGLSCAHSALHRRDRLWGRLIGRRRVTREIRRLCIRVCIREAAGAAPRPLLAGTLAFLDATFGRWP